MHKKHTPYIYSMLFNFQIPVWSSVDSVSLLSFTPTARRLTRDLRSLPGGYSWLGAAPASDPVLAPLPPPPTGDELGSATQHVTFTLAAVKRVRLSGSASD